MFDYFVGCFKKAGVLYVFYSKIVKFTFAIIYASAKKLKDFLEQKFALRSQFLSGLSGLEILELQQFQLFADYMFAS